MDIEIRPLTATDAPQLVRCFERCYGSTYPNETFYDPESIVALLDTGKLKSVVAVCADGTIVGHTGLTLNNPDAGVAEAGNTVVDPEYRGAGILGEMGSALAQLCRSCGFAGYVHYPTAAHDVIARVVEVLHLVSADRTHAERSQDGGEGNVGHRRKRRDQRSRGRPIGESASFTCFGQCAERHSVE